MNQENDRQGERTTKRNPSAGSDWLVNLSRTPQKQRVGVAGLTYAHSLRAIGHSLDLSGVKSFELKKHGEEFLVRVMAGASAPKGSLGNYLVKKVFRIVLQRRSDEKETVSIPEVAQPLRYTFADIRRLDEDARSRRGQGKIMPEAHNPSQVLRVIGAHLDRRAARAFTISVSTRSVSVWYENGVGTRNWECFDMTNLYDRAIHMLLARSKKADERLSARKNPLSP